MTTYYVSPNGSNAFNGLGPDASHATNKPFLTVGKTTNTGSPVLPGDSVIIAPASFFSEALVPIASIASVASPTQWIGDPTNAYGFKDGSGVRLAPGIPWVTTRTAAEGIDGAAATGGALIAALTNNPKGMQFKKLMLECLAGTIWSHNYNGSTDTLFEDCLLSATTIVGGSATAPTAGMNLTFRRCSCNCNIVLSANVSVAAATADADLNLLVEECFVIGIFCAGISIGASGGNIGGGIRLYDNTWIARTTLIGTTALRVSTVAPVRYAGNLVIGFSGIANAGTAGQIVDDGYNRSIGNGTNTNCTPAGTTIISVAPNLNWPTLVKWGLQMPRGDFLGWTDAAHANQKFSASGRTTPDFRGLTPRPWGAGSSIGCWQVPNITHDTSSAITGGGTDSLMLTGAGEPGERIYIPVDAVATTVSVTTKSTSYGGTNYPQLVVVANPSIGIPADITATASSASEQTITSASFTPTAKGAVEVRLISRSSSTTSTTHFDLLTTS